MGDEEKYHLTPKGVLGSAYDELQRYMLLLKHTWKLGPNETVGVVLSEDGRLVFDRLDGAPPPVVSKPEKGKKGGTAKPAKR